MLTTKTTRESVNFRLEAKLLKAARKKAQKENTSLTALVVQGLNIVLGNSSKNNSIDFSVEVQNRLDELNTRVEQLEQAINRRPSKKNS